MMSNLITDLFFPREYIPHGHCYLWQPNLVWLHLISDLMIGLAYFSIPAFLIYFVSKRKDVPFSNLFVLFGAFIISCGTTHFLSIWVLWHPAYWILGGVKLLTGLVSLYTVIEIIPILPKALNLPSPAQLAALNQELINQINEREEAEKEIRQLNTELEQRVLERTLDLELLNLQLQESKYFAEKIAELTPNVIYIYDLQEKKNVFINRFSAEVLGYSPQEILEMGDTFIEIVIHPEDLKHIKEHFENCFYITGDEFEEIQYRMKDVKGEWHWLSGKDAIFERDDQGRAKQIIGVAYEITNQKKTEIELKKLNEELAARVKDLENRNQEMIVLGEINDHLQACLTVQEAESALSDLLNPLFQECCGTVFMVKSSQDIFESVARWGKFQVSKETLLPSECWGIRRGYLHKVQSTTPNLICQHIETKPTTGVTVCLPLNAQGENIGLLHLYFENSQDFTAAKQQLAQTLSKQLALSFANLKLQQTLKDQSLIDGLTGLYNRRYFQQCLTSEVGYSLRKQQPLGLIMLDIDYFKRFNDLYGHQAGDLVLSEIAYYLRENIRSYDIACRYGGEELAIIMPGSPLENTLIRAEKLREGIKSLRIKYASAYLGEVTASFGVACFPAHGETCDHLLMLADQALYEAKRQGRDRVVAAS